MIGDEDDLTLPDDLVEEILKDAMRDPPPPQQQVPDGPFMRPTQALMGTLPVDPPPGLLPPFGHQQQSGLSAPDHPGNNPSLYEEFFVMPRGDCGSALPSRVLRRYYDVGHSVMMMNYTELSMKSPEVLDLQEDIYLGDSTRVVRDLARQSRFRRGNVSGDLVEAVVDLNNVVPGFDDLGTHGIPVYMTHDAYGPLYSLNRIMIAFGYRSGGSADQVVRIAVDAMPTEVRLRVVPVNMKITRTGIKSKEYMTDVHALKSFLIGFGCLERQPNGVCAQIKKALVDERVSTDVCKRFLYSVLTEPK